MQLFLDTTDVAVLKDLAMTGLVDGVTTNPTLIAKSGRPMLQVIAESDEWRRICDPEGTVAWVHQRTLDNRRTVMRTAAQGLPLLRGPDPRSPEVAVLDGRSLAAFDSVSASFL